jgi:hypothetical protein
LAISRSSGASPPDMTSSPPASWDSSCSDASVSGRGLSTGPSAKHVGGQRGILRRPEWTYHLALHKFVPCALGSVSDNLEPRPRARAREATCHPKRARIDKLEPLSDLLCIRMHVTTCFEFNPNRYKQQIAKPARWSTNRNLLGPTACCRTRPACALLLQTVRGL